MPSADPSKKSRALLLRGPLGKGAAPLPAVSAPRPPHAFIPQPGSSLLGSRVKETEVAKAADVIKELSRFAGYEETFGALVPDKSDVMSILELALQWREQRDAAAAWDEYCRSQNRVAWATALDVLNDLKPAFLLALKRDRAVGVQCPRLVDLFRARKEIAKKANATKRKKKAAAAGVVEPKRDVPAPKKKRVKKKG